MSTASMPPEGMRTTSGPAEGATRIVLIRHGQGSVNVSGVIGGVTGCTGLTELGRRQVAALARRLAESRELTGASAVYASTLPRAIETAKIVAPALGLTAQDVIEESGLSELHPGEADGLVWEVYMERFGAPDWDIDPHARMAPGAESWSSFVDRCGAALEELAQRHEGELIVVGTHAGFIESTVLRHLVGSPEGAAHPRLRLRTAHASLTEWERTESGWRLIRYNDAYARV